MTGIGRRIAVALMLLSGWLVSQGLPAPQPVSVYPGLSVELRSVSGVRTFPLGAPIELQVVYNSSLAGHYQYCFSGYRRQAWGGAVEVTPDQGWHDPLARLNRLFTVSANSGACSFGTLSATPVLDTFYLNSWVRFETPGQYSIAVVSTGLTLSGSSPESIRVLTPPLTITMVADPPGWREAHLASAVAALAAPDRRAWGDAIYTLSALGGSDAARALARLCGEPAWGCRDAVAETEAPEAAVPVLEQMITDSQKPVAQSLLLSLATFRMLADGATSDDWDRYSDGVLADLAAALPHKQGAALTSSLAVVLNLQPGRLSPSARAWVTQALAEHWGELSDEDRAIVMTAMGQTPDPLGGPMELALVRNAATMPPPRRAGPWATAAALQHWYGLAPAEARAAVLDAIAGAGAESAYLGFLPDKTLPQLDGRLLSYLDAAASDRRGDYAASLLARYGSAAAADPVIAALDEGGPAWGCNRRVPLLAYLARVRPDAAVPRLQALLSSPSPPRGCGPSVLQQMSPASPALEQVALAQLTNTAEAPDAIIYLQQHGDATAEAALWQLWASSETTPQLRAALRRALYLAQGWVVGPAEITKLEVGTTGDEAGSMEAMVAEWQAPPWVIRRNGGAYTLLQYAGTIEQIKEKMSQFPAGSQFACADAMAGESPGFPCSQ